MRNNYWTCSKFADWLRGSAKPEAETSKGWRQWKRAAKEKHPFRFWLVEEGLDTIQDIWMWIPDRINDVRYYVNNRFITRTHCLTAHPRDIKPGQWHDVGNRFLPCLMNELVDFVEIEQAWHHCAWSEEAQAQYRMPKWRRWYRQWRCPEAGIAYLEWAATLTNEEFLDDDKKHLAEPTHQAVAAREILAIYTWWKEVYPNRPDPYDVSGWTKICARRREQYPDEILPEDQTKKEKSESKKAIDTLHKLEAEYQKEDESMMIRLIKIRESLWT